MVPIFTNPISTSSETASGQYSGHLGKFVVQCPKTKADCLPKDLMYASEKSSSDTLQHKKN